MGIVPASKPWAMLDFLVTPQRLTWNAELGEGCNTPLWEFRETLDAESRFDEIWGPHPWSVSGATSVAYPVFPNLYLCHLSRWNWIKGYIGTGFEPAIHRPRLPINFAKLTARQTGQRRSIDRSTKPIGQPTHRSISGMPTSAVCDRSSDWLRSRCLYQRCVHYVIIIINFISALGQTTHAFMYR